MFLVCHKYCKVAHKISKTLLTSILQTVLPLLSQMHILLLQQFNVGSSGRGQTSNSANIEPLPNLRTAASVFSANLH